MRRSVGVAIAAFVCLSLAGATAAIAGSPQSSATGAGTDTAGRKFELSAHNGPQGAQGQMKYHRAPGDTVHADVTCLSVGVDLSGNNVAAVVGTITNSNDSLNPVGGTLRFVLKDTGNGPGNPPDEFNADKTPDCTAGSGATGPTVSGNVTIQPGS